MKYVLGIDPSLTGFALAFGTRTGKKHEILELSSKSRGQELTNRLRRYDEFVLRIQEEITERGPELILIEGYSYASRGSVISLGEFGILVRQSLFEVTDNVLEVAPSLLKKFATGKGNAGKSQMVSEITRRYDVTFKTDNEADAFALMQMARIVHGWSKCETKFQEEAVAKLIAGVRS